MEQPNHFGVDYGSKLAGTTTVAILLEGKLHLFQSQPGHDADEWLKLMAEKYRPSSLFIDAPLTLPKVYTQNSPIPEADYFYRNCDREVKAMSPMFLGGLTARAIRLRSLFATKGMAMLETYPSLLAKTLFPELEGYKKGFENLEVYTSAFQSLLPFLMETAPTNWHQFDGLLAWYSGYRHQNQKSKLYGDAKEGRIIV